MAKRRTGPSQHATFEEAVAQARANIQKDGWTQFYRIFGREGCYLVLDCETNEGEKPIAYLPRLGPVAPVFVYVPALRRYVDRARLD